MADLVRQAHLLNTLHQDRDAIEQLLLTRAAALALPNVRALKAKYVALSRRIARLEAKLK